MKSSQHIYPALSMFLLAVLLFNTCNDTHGGDVPDELPKGEGLIPAVIGNQWIYSDSLWMSDSLYYAYFDTVEIVDTLIRGDQIWWQTKGMIPGLWGEFYIRNDSIYGSDYVFDTRLTHLWFVPPSETPISYYVDFEDTGGWIRTVVMQPEPITVPAGMFDSCGVYTDTHNHMEHIIAPGVGIIRRSVIRPNSRWIITLIDYELVLD
ncbi:MAG: hypothetical protein ACE5D0_10670, partial [Fidelibacterota bacterium]